MSPLFSDNRIQVLIAIRLTKMAATHILLQIEGMRGFRLDVDSPGNWYKNSSWSVDRESQLSPTDRSRDLAQHIAFSANLRGYYPPLDRPIRKATLLAKSHSDTFQCLGSCVLPNYFLPVEARLFHTIWRRTFSEGLAPAGHKEAGCAAREDNSSTEKHASHIIQVWSTKCQSPFSGLAFPSIDSSLNRLDSEGMGA